MSSLLSVIRVLHNLPPAAVLEWENIIRGTERQRYILFCFVSSLQCNFVSLKEIYCFTAKCNLCGWSCMSITLFAVSFSPLLRGKNLRLTHITVLKT